MERYKSKRGTVILIAIASVVAILSTVGYLSYLRWEARSHAQQFSQRSGCVYLGRILGTQNVVVMKCDDKIELREAE